MGTFFCGTTVFDFFMVRKMQQHQDTATVTLMVTVCLLWATAHGSRGKQWEVEGDEAACHVLGDGI